MNISVKTLVITGVITLAGGLLLGRVFFGGSSESEHSQTEIIDGKSVWTCSMHPQIRQNEPGDCPICGMDLIPLEDDAGDNIDPMAVSMSKTAMQLANISTMMVGESPAVKTIRLNGKVQEDERLIYSQTAHFPGRVENLSVNFTGEYVSQGSTIAFLYSPELVTAQEELFETIKIKNSQPDLYRAAREKLKKWKLTETQIDQIIASGNPKEKFPVTADHSGYVTTKKVNLGDYVKRGQSLYEIANLSQIWVLFDVYEKDLVWINKGDSVSFTIGSIPGESFNGTINYIDPVIDPKTRVAKARVIVSNQKRQLKPEMFASGEIKANVGESKSKLTVPKSAVMWTGKRSVVYVKIQTDQGVSFKMREVTLGPALGDAFIIEEGLQTGEEIAINGTFSIDAAAQLAGKPSMMMSPEGGASMTGHNHQGEKSSSIKMNMEVNMSDQTYSSDPVFKEQLQTVFVAYLPVKDALIESDAQTASKESVTLLKAIENVDMTLVQGEAHNVWMKDLKVLLAATEFIAQTNDLEKTRDMLSPLSDQLYHTLKKFKVNVKGYRQYCPMAFDNEGAFWLSDSDEILNPYFGDAMLTCGNVEDEL